MSSTTQTTNQLKSNAISCENCPSVLKKFEDPAAQGPGDGAETPSTV